VQITNGTSVLAKYTDRDGRAEFVLTAGGYEMRVSKPFYYTHVEEFRFPAENDTIYPVSLIPMEGVWIPPGSNYTVPAPLGFVWLAVNVRYSDGAPFQGGIRQDLQRDRLRQPRLLRPDRRHRVLQGPPEAQPDV